MLKSRLRIRQAGTREDSGVSSGPRARPGSKEKGLDAVRGEVYVSGIPTTSDPPVLCSKATFSPWSKRMKLRAGYEVLLERQAGPSDASAVSCRSHRCIGLAVPACVASLLHEEYPLEGDDQVPSKRHSRSVSSGRSSLYSL